MMLTLLLDLDDTLLDSHLNLFVPAYFQALAEELAPYIGPECMIKALVSGTNLMNENEDFSQTLETVFSNEFFTKINIPQNSLQPVIENFYDNVFPALSNLTAPKPEAKSFVDWAFSQGIRIAIATDPLFPKKATYHRIRWAGFQPEQFELVSTFDGFHFSKTHPAYYAEVLGRMGWPEGPVLMVGNDLERDILPAKKLGLATYQVDEEFPPKSGEDAVGKLADLQKWILQKDLAELIPSFKTIDSVLAILSATPAVFNGLAGNLEFSEWSEASAPGDWTLTELLCHLRDTEREIHQMQISLFSAEDDPFIPRPDTSVWASRRDYLHENGESVLREFNQARFDTLKLLKQYSHDEWGRKARHAIFGPTNFLEIVGFIADHDRMHIQQAWGILKKK